MQAIEGELRELIDEYRARCLWFLRPDYYPETDSDALRTLERIQRHGDLAGFKRAGKLKQCLLPSSNGGSAG